MNKVYSVTELAGELKGLLETQFFVVTVRGEVSGVRTTTLGHTYFTLKDANAQISCAWFHSRRLAAQAGTMIVNRETGEVIQSAVTPSLLEKGGEFAITGKISFYPQRGTCQIVVHSIAPSGIGLLAQKFEERKQALAKMGYFDASRKKPLPPHPRRIALVTSESGAAIRDFLKIANTRGLSARIRLFPTLVQGQAAALAIACAIQTACEQKWAEVLVLIRGGGSLEDLWCFNEQVLVDAIYHATIPVVAGIGHEIDITLADMTADVRAATPTHAAELLWQPRTTLLQELAQWTRRCFRSFQAYVENLRKQLAHEDRALHLSSPKNRVNALVERYQSAERALASAIFSLVQEKDQQLFALTTRLRAFMAPERLDRQVSHVALLTQRMSQSVTREIDRLDRDCAELETRLYHAITRRLEDATSQLRTSTALLYSASPLALLERGYALVEDEDGQLVRSVTALAPGAQVRVSLADGHFTANVRTCTERAEPK